MRIVSKLERNKKQRMPNSKIYIIPEGDKTEVQYFLGIEQNKDDLKIDQLIQILVMENEEEERGHSFPLLKFNNFNKGIEENKYIYDKDIDKACFIIDRDKGNFSIDQLEKFIAKCKEKEYDVYISNPTFEFFLILHSDEVFKYDRDEMYENEYVSTRKRYLERIVNKLFGCNKTNINFEKFKPNIEKAILNEKHFANTIEELKTQLGSNVGTLLEEMMK